MCYLHFLPVDSYEHRSSSNLPPSVTSSPIAFATCRDDRRARRKVPGRVPVLTLGAGGPARALVLRGDASDRLLGELPGAEEGAAEVRRERERSMNFTCSTSRSTSWPYAVALSAGPPTARSASSAPSLRAACARRCGCERSRQRRSGGRGGSPSSARSQRRARTRCGSGDQRGVAVESPIARRETGVFG
jgi:hypothetical protein